MIRNTSTVLCGILMMIQQMPAPCPVVNKNQLPHDVEFKVTKTVPCVIPTSEPIILKSDRRLTEFSDDDSSVRQQGLARLIYIPDLDPLTVLLRGV